MSNSDMVEMASPSGAGPTLGTARVNSGHGSLVDKGKKIVTDPQYPRHCGITECTKEMKKEKQGQ